MESVGVEDLLHAIDALDVDGVSTILAQYPELVLTPVRTELEKTQTLLHRAIPGDGEPLLDAHLTIVQCILDAGADTDTPGWGANNGLCTSLTMAAWGGHAPIVRLLLARGAKPNGSAEQIERGNRPIDAAARHGHSEAVEALADGGAEYAFAHLLAAGLAERVEHVLDHDPAAPSRTTGGMPPLHVALSTRTGAKLVSLLLDRGADANQADGNGRRVLHAAIEIESADSIELLLERGAEVDVYAAAGLGDSARLAEHLRADSTLAPACAPDGASPLHYAAWSGCDQCARMLLDHGAKASPRSERFWACLTPLHISLQRRHRGITAILLSRGVDLEACRNLPDRYWPTPLHSAARWGTLDDVSLLLDAGADPNGGAPVPESMDTGVIGWMSLTRDTQLAKLLLARGLDSSSERNREALRQCGITRVGGLDRAQEESGS